MFNPCQSASGLSPVKIALIFDATSLLSDPYEDRVLNEINTQCTCSQTVKVGFWGLFGSCTSFVKKFPVVPCSWVDSRKPEETNDIVPIPKLRTLHYTFLFMLQKNSEVLHCS